MSAPIINQSNGIFDGIFVNAARNLQAAASGFKLSSTMATIFKVSLLVAAIFCGVGVGLFLGLHTTCPILLVPLAAFGATAVSFHFLSEFARSVVMLINQ